jgi:hypothetical protein
MSTGVNAKREVCRRELADSFPATEAQKPDELRYSGRAKAFLIVPDELVLSGKALTHGAKIMWMAIFKHNWRTDPRTRISWPGRERLAAICGIRPRQATKYLNELRRKGLLRTKRRFDKSSLYLLADPPKSWMWRTRRELELVKRAQRERSEARRRAELEAFSRQNVQKSAHPEVQDSAHIIG